MYPLLKIVIFQPVMLVLSVGSLWQKSLNFLALEPWHAHTTSREHFAKLPFFQDRTSINPPQHPRGRLAFPMLHKHQQGNYEQFLILEWFFYAFLVVPWQCRVAPLNPEIHPHHLPEEEGSMGPYQDLWQNETNLLRGAQDISTAEIILQIGPSPTFLKKNFQSSGTLVWLVSLMSCCGFAFAVFLRKNTGPRSCAILPVHV